MSTDGKNAKGKGSVVPPPTETESPENEALNLVDGTYGVVIGSTGDFGFVNASYTVECWLKIPALHGGDQAILGHGEKGGADHKAIHLTLRDGKPYMGHHGDDSDSPIPMITGEWAHLAFVYELKNHSQSIYVNGMCVCHELDDDGADHRQHHPLKLPTSLLIGYSWGPGTHPLRGFIAHLMIWNRSRSQSEIRTDMYRDYVNSERHQIAIDAKNNGLNSYWPLLGGSLMEMVRGKAVGHLIDQTGAAYLRPSGAIPNLKTLQSLRPEFPDDKAMKLAKVHLRDAISKADSNAYALAVSTTEEAVPLSTTLELGLVGCSYTVECWVKPIETDEIITNDRGIMGIGSANENGHIPNVGLHLTIRDGRSYLGHFNNDLHGPTVEVDCWTHIAFRYDIDKKEQSILHNGVVVATGHNRSCLKGSAPLWIGRCTDTVLRGLMADLRIWSGVVRTEEQIKAVMHRSYLGLVDAKDRKDSKGEADDLKGLKASFSFAESVYDSVSDRIWHLSKPVVSNVTHCDPNKPMDAFRYQKIEPAAKRDCKPPHPPPVWPVLTNPSEQQYALNLIVNQSFGMSIGSTADYDMLNGSYTVECWLYVPKTKTSGDQTILAFVGSPDSRDSCAIHLVIRNSKLYFGHFNDDSHAPVSVVRGAWTHVAFVFQSNSERKKPSGDGNAKERDTKGDDGDLPPLNLNGRARGRIPRMRNVGDDQKHAHTTGAQSVYVNGSCISSSPWHYALRRPVRLCLGCYDRNPLRGHIAHLKIWNTARSLQQIRTDAFVDYGVVTSPHETGNSVSEPPLPATAAVSASPVRSPPMKRAKLSEPDSKHGAGTGGAKASVGDSAALEADKADGLQAYWPLNGSMFEVVRGMDVGTWVDATEPAANSVQPPPSPVRWAVVPKIPILYRDRVIPPDEAALITGRTAFQNALGKADTEAHALYVGKSSDRVPLATARDLGLWNSSFTVECWVKLTEEFGSYGSDRGIMGCVSSDYYVLSHGLHLAIRNGASYMGFYNNDIAGPAVDTGRWVHIAFRYDMEQKEQSIAHNGIVVVSGKDRAPLQGATAPIWLGTDLSETNPLGGWIADLRIWNHVRSEEQIRKFMRKAFFGITRSPPVPTPITSAGAKDSKSDVSVPTALVTRSDDVQGLILSLSFAGSLYDHCKHQMWHSLLLSSTSIDECVRNAKYEPVQLPRRRAMPAHREAFLMGFHKRLGAQSPLQSQSFSRNALFDRHMLAEILAFTDPKPVLVPLYPGLNPDGSEQYALNMSDGSYGIDLKSSADFGLLNASFTVEVWLNLPRLRRGGDQTVLGFSEPHGFTGGAIHLTFRDTYPYHGHHDDDSRADQSMITGKWAHIAFVYDQDRKAQLIYVDGAKWLDDSGNHRPLARTCALGLGYSWGFNNNPINGSAAHLKILNVARTGQQIRSDMFEDYGLSDVKSEAEAKKATAAAAGAAGAGASAGATAAAAAPSQSFAADIKCGLNAYWPFAGNLMEMVRGREVGEAAATNARGSDLLRWSGIPKLSKMKSS